MIVAYACVLLCVCVCDFRDGILLRRGECKTRENIKLEFFKKKGGKNGNLS